MNVLQSVLIYTNKEKFVLLGEYGIVSIIIYPKVMLAIHFLGYEIALPEAFRMRGIV